MSVFKIDARLLESSVQLATLDLCDARLKADGRWPWIVLIPRRGGLRELEELTATDQVLLLQDIALAGQAVRAIGKAIGRPVERLNIGALGNVVAQLHLHVVGRRSDDPAWPNPVWGFDEASAQVLETSAVSIAKASLEGSP